jgi:glycerophosphoryl diester phosphodiesterase
MRPRPPRIIAHRGLPRERPENTLAGFEAALGAGVDGLELDVHATRDGRVVVHHDPMLPPDAAGALAGRRIAELEWAELAAHRVQRLEPVPLLADVLRAAAGRATVHVEIKGTGIEALVVDGLRASACDAVVHAFDHRVAARVRALLPERPTGVLSTSYLVDTPAAMRAADAVTLWQHWSMIDAALVRDVHGAGGTVIAWTVNDPEVARELAGFGVDGLCSDVPADVRAALTG